MNPPDEKASKPISVLFCCNPAFYQHMAVALVSLLESNKAASFDVHLLTSAQDKALEEKLHHSIAKYRRLALTIRVVPLDRYAHFFVSSHITLESYFRILAADLLSDDIEKILYLDCDLVVVDEIMELWDTPLRDHAVAAAPDLYGGFRREALGMPARSPYVNAGVLLLNLWRWRREGIGRRLIRFVEEHGELTFHDQDAINAVLHDSILLLDRRWNVQAQMYCARRRAVGDDLEAIREACRTAAVIHYAGPEKPWRFRVSVARRHLYFRYLNLTAWRGAALQGMAWYHLPEHWLGVALGTVGIDYVRVLSLAGRCWRLAIFQTERERRAAARRYRTPPAVNPARKADAAR